MRCPIKLPGMEGRCSFLVLTMGVMRSCAVRYDREGFVHSLSSACSLGGIISVAVSHVRL